jgi:hypothetical protein
MIAPRSAGVLDRAAAWFVAPPAGAPRPALAAAPPDHAPRAVVLGAPSEAPAVAGALAGALRSLHRSPAAVVAVIAADGSADRSAPAPPAFPGARRLAARLVLRGLDARPRGRLAWLASASVEDATRLGSLDVPLVLAVAAPRTAAIDSLLAEQDLIAVVDADPDGPLARMAIAGLAGTSAEVVACRPPYGPVRLLALAGLASERALDPPLRAAVRGLR